MDNYPVWRGPRGAGITPEQQADVDAAIEASENLAVALPQVEAARVESTAAAVATAEDRVQTGADRAATETYASAAGTAARFYDTIALGRAAVADGETFGVRSGGTDGLIYPTTYRRDSSATQTLLVELVNASEVEAVAEEAAAETLAREAADDAIRSASGDPENIPVSGWVTVDIDAEEKMVRGMDTLGQSWRAERDAAFVEAPADIAETMPGWESVTVDSDGRSVEATASDGVILGLRGSRLIPLSNDGSLRAGAAYGDSTTYGDELEANHGASWKAMRWTTLLGQRLGGTIYNRGINGHRSEHIVARAGAMEITATVPSGSIPASGPVNLANASTNWVQEESPQGIRVVRAICDGGEVIEGRWNVSGSTRQFQRYEAGDVVATKYLSLVSEQGWKDLSRHVFVGMGINDEPNIVAGTTTTQSIKDLYRSIHSAARGGCTIWGILDRGVNEAAGTTIGDYIDEMERFFRAEFGRDYCPVRPYLASDRALSDALIFNPSFVATTGDTDAVAVGRIPPAFRFGGVHLNALGHQLQALFMSRWLTLRYGL